jgi:hypothetical protein
MTELLSRPYAMRIVWAFDALDDANQRHALVHFVETMKRGKKWPSSIFKAHDTDTGTVRAFRFPPIAAPPAKSDSPRCSR